MSVSPGSTLPAYESVFHQGCKDLLKEFMLGVCAEISLILVVYTEMKQTEKHFVINNYLGCLKVTKAGKYHHSCKNCRILGI